MERNSKIFLLVIILAGVSVITIGTYAITRQGEMDPSILLITMGGGTRDNFPTSNHPADFNTTNLGSETINWKLYDDIGPGQYRVWLNDTNDNYYIWVNWTPWISGSEINIAINRTELGKFNYTIEFNDSINQFGISDSVIVIVELTMWTWISGTSDLDQPGVYGTKGMADENNVPGCRYASVSWIDSTGNLWLFGGYGDDNMTGTGYLNDLWKFDGVNWTWVSGNFTRNQPGFYGTQKVPNANNIPGARWEAVSWIDGNDDLWLFGGQGRDASNATGNLNDLWKFDTDSLMWTWISGSSSVNQFGIYGIKGIADESNVPGARYQSISWRDTTGNLWLFGGWGRNDTGQGYLNDLWKFDGVNWTWMSGSNETAKKGVYGTQEVPDANNFPGARYASTSWIDGNDNL